MKTYKTLRGEIFDLGELTPEQKAIYTDVKSAFDSNTEWTDFSNLWIARMGAAFDGIPRSEVVEEPLYKICQDLESRLGIRQGHTSEPDYRDLLAEVISLHYRSRYQFCAEMGFDEGYLSSVLSKKKNLSLKKLEEILGRTNYRIAFVERVEKAS